MGRRGNLRAQQSTADYQKKQNKKFLLWEGCGQIGENTHNMYGLGETTEKAIEHLRVKKR